MKSVLIWDWDGTLVDSIGFKYDGIWSEVFSGEPGRRDKAKAFVQTPEGKAVNRYGLIQHTLVYTGLPELAQVPDDVLTRHPLVRKYAERYGKAAEVKTYTAGLFAGVADMLERLSKDDYPLYVISGGGTDEDLNRMADYFGIKEYFQDIFGFGNLKMSSIGFGKYENIDRVDAIEKYRNSHQYIVIGDGESDAIFAHTIGSKFIGIANKWNEWREDGVGVVSATREAEKLIRAFE